MVVFFLFTFDACVFSTFIVAGGGGFGIGAFGKEELATGRVCNGDDDDPPGVVGGVGLL